MGPGESTMGDLQEEKEELTRECREMLMSLPKEKGWRTSHLYMYQGYWCHSEGIQGIVSAQKHFQAQDADIIVTSLPRSGTIWLKALVFSIVNRKQFPDFAKHPLLTSSPHKLIPFLEFDIYGGSRPHVRPRQDFSGPDFSDLGRPRLLSTHMAFELLPESIKSSNCRIVYICRNPLDNFISLWHINAKMRPEALGPLLLEEAFDMYCRGISTFGPFWGQMLGYWKQSLENPEKVLFLKYEEMKGDTILQVKRVAEFLGFPFSLEEEKEGAAEEIVRFCSFLNMKEKFGDASVVVDHHHQERNNEKIELLRKGEVGDWENYLTPSMVERLSKTTEERLSGSGLAFQLKLQGRNQ